MRVPTLTLAVASVVGALLIAGCGESSLGALSVTKGEFIRQADLICGKADLSQPREFEAFTVKHRKQLEKLDPVASEATVSRDLKLPSAKQQIKEIEALEVPPGEEQRISRIIAGWKAVVRLGEGNPYRFGIWWNDRDPFIEMKKVALDYGFRDCEDLR